MILSDDFHESALRGSRVLEVDAGLHSNLGQLSRGLTLAAFEEGLKRRFAVDDVDQTVTEAFELSGIQLESAIQIGELKGVQYDTGSIGKGIGLEDVHAPTGKDAGNRSEECRPIRGENGQREDLARLAHVGLHFVDAKFSIHDEMARNFFRRVGCEIAAGEPFEEARDLWLGDAAGERLHLCKNRSFVGSVEAVAVEAAAEVVGSSYEKLPE